MKDTTTESSSLFGTFVFLLGLYVLYVGWSFFTGVVNSLEKIETHLAVIATCADPQLEPVSPAADPQTATPDPSTP